MNDIIINCKLKNGKLFFFINLFCPLTSNARLEFYTESKYFVYMGIYVFHQTTDVVLFKIQLKKTIFPNP